MTKSNKKSVALSSVLASGLLTLMKLAAGIMTNSIGIISEAAHSALDFGAALITYFAVRISDQPADKEHPYGHGKIESISALTETALLYITSFWIIWEAVERLWFKETEVTAAWYAFAIILISIAVDISRSRALNKAAKEHHSQALEADALHFSSDCWSSLVVLFGLIFVRFGIHKADAIAAIAVAVFVLYVGFKLGKRTLDVLLDAAPEGLIERITEISKKVDGVLEVGKVRVRPAGASVFIDMNVSVNRKISLDQSHDICEKIENDIRQSVPGADITIHTCPLPHDTETILERVRVTALNQNLSVHDIAVQTENDKKYLHFDLEVKSDLSIKEAHQIATRLEKALEEEFGDDVETNIHIDPLEPKVTAGQHLPDQEDSKIKETILKLAESLSSVRGIHNIQIRTTEEKLFISLHCLFDGALTLDKAHHQTSRLEYLIKEEFPRTQRVVIHAEPADIKEC